jgi:hypothetical protein
MCNDSVASQAVDITVLNHEYFKKSELMYKSFDQIAALIYACMANDARFNCGLTHSNLFH